jgi:hypothetical protein
MIPSHIAACSLALCLALPSTPRAGAGDASSSAAPVAAAKVGSIVGLSGFVENRGQWDEEVLFFARRYGVEVTVTRAALVFRPAPVLPEAWRDVQGQRLREEGMHGPWLEDPDGADARGESPAPLVLRLPGDASCRVVEGLDPLPTRHHFLVGAHHATGALGYGRVALRDVVAGVDVVLRADGDAFEYDLVLAPGARLEDVVIEVEGAFGAKLRAADALVLSTEAGTVEQRIPAAWQGAEREAVDARFRLLGSAGGRQRFGFEAPGWDRARALVVDPTVVFLTYVGGSGTEYLREVEAGPDGSLYFLAKSSGGTPVTPGAFQEVVSGAGADAWVGKLAADGTALEWATFLGGSNSEDPADFALAADGSLVVLGTTWSEDFPVTPGAFQSVKAGTKSDVFLAKLTAAGDALGWATFYGSENQHDTALACALYPGGDTLFAYHPYYVGDPPATLGAIDEVFDEDDKAFVRLAADGSQRLWQTYFRVSTVDDLVIDEDSNAYFGGAILPSLGPLTTTPGAFQESWPGGLYGISGYVSKMNSTGTELVWSTYLGGTWDDRVWGIALDAARAVYVAGTTESPDFPVSASAFQTTIDGTEGFVAKLLPGGTDLAWASIVGATGFAGGTSITDLKVDSGGNPLLLGAANEPDFPVTPDAFQPFFIGPLPSSSDALLCRLDALAEDLLYATWIGSDGSDTHGKLATDANGGAWAAFQAWWDLKTTPGAYQPTHAGSTDLAVAKFQFEVLPWTILPGGVAGKDLPSLVGLGSLASGSPTRLALRGAPASSPAVVLAGTQQVDLPLFGGTLVPLPVVVLPWTTDSSGAAEIVFPWPAAPSGTKLFFQVGCQDPLAPQGWSASNGLMASSP